MALAEIRLGEISGLSQDSSLTCQGVCLLFTLSVAFVLRCVTCSASITYNTDSVQLTCCFACNLKFGRSSELDHRLLPRSASQSFPRLVLSWILHLCCIRLEYLQRPLSAEPPFSYVGGPLQFVCWHINEYMYLPRYTCMSRMSLS